MNKQVQRTLLWSVACALMVTTGSMAAPSKDKAGASNGYKVDTQASEVRWVGKKVTGQHNGTVQIKDGQIHVADGKATGGQIDVDMTSIKVLDLEGDSNAKLTGHLKSDDFFGTDKFPVATFALDKIEPLANSDANSRVTGRLTIKGQTHPVFFPASITVDKDTVRASAKDVKIDRTLYGIRYGSGKFFQNLGDKTIYDEFSIDFDVVAKKAAKAAK